MNKKREENLALLCEILEDVAVVDIEDIVPSSRIVEDLGMDSMDLLELTFCIEDEWELSMTPEALQPMTVSGLLDYLEEHSKVDSTQH